MMERREREALDRHITGNYGEDSAPEKPQPQKCQSPRCERPATEEVYGERVCRQCYRLMTA